MKVYCYHTDAGIVRDENGNHKHATIGCYDEKNKKHLGFCINSYRYHDFYNNVSAMETYSIFHGILNGLTNYFRDNPEDGGIIQVYNDNLKACDSVNFYLKETTKIYEGEKEPQVYISGDKNKLLETVTTFVDFRRFANLYRQALEDIKNNKLKIEVIWVSGDANKAHPVAQELKENL